MEFSLDLATEFAKIIIAVAASAALMVSFWTVVQARRTAEANHVSAFLERYGSEEVHKHLRLLGDFKSNEDALIKKLHNLIDNTENLGESDKDTANAYVEKFSGTLELARRDIHNLYLRR